MLSIDHPDVISFFLHVYITTLINYKQILIIMGTDIRLKRPIIKIKENILVWIVIDYNKSVYCRRIQVLVIYRFVNLGYKKLIIIIYVSHKTNKNVNVKPFQPTYFHARHLPSHPTNPNHHLSPHPRIPNPIIKLIPRIR